MWSDWPCRQSNQSLLIFFFSFKSLPSCPAQPPPQPAAILFYPSNKKSKVKQQALGILHTPILLLYASLWEIIYWISVFAPLNLNVENISVYVYQVSVVQKQNKTGKSSMRILVLLFFWGPLWTRKGGKTHRFTQRFLELCTAQQKNKRGGWSCFEEAQDSYGLEANHKEKNHTL